MPESSLVMRAEQALLASLLIDVSAIVVIELLDAADFGHALNRQLFTAITAARTSDPVLIGAALAAQLAASAGIPGVDEQWLTQLQDAAPDTGHALAYARIIGEAAFRRELASDAERLAGAPKGAGGRLLADALGRVTTVHAPYVASEYGDPATSAAPEAPAQATSTPDSRHDLEAELLADLVAHPEQADALVRFLHADTFTSPASRQVWTAVEALAGRGEPIDTITIEWEATNQLADRTASSDTPNPEPPAPTAVASYLIRLGRTQPHRPAVAIGRDLLANDVRADLAGRKTTSRQASTRAAAPRKAGIDPTLRPPAPPQPPHGPRPTP
ncbi:DnaB-like helicase N-terminal domain-containing protein [Pilimelia columellifera]|uniref:DnaB-like helicase N-terminal domain-containing protein n=1 Tax=Pilimelia columellifera subsp. columellifera TaxID=706583 RepID=A0ABN3NIK2_9ACTN